jgi:aminoglycoside phosphotransferase family enzyme/predicted kinase
MDEQDQAAAIAFLADPVTHGGAEVRRIDTHASVVFLAGNHAFKLKRAVRFSYLDYSTLAARERFCRAELALNRRTAPDLYQEVRSIARAADGRLSFDGPGAVIDWVVVMRRFDQETLFDRLAERRRLTTPLMLELAEQIARFHGGADVDTEAGGLAGMAETVASDARNLRAAVPDVLASAAVEALIAAVQEQLARVGGVLEERRRAGRVRHCHGDLHLRNICLVDGRPTLFDGIEFNRTMSNIDVLYDLAFLLMDLHARGLGGLGNGVFNRYLDLRAEADGLPALPLFLAVRAAVRAHVGAAAAQTQPSAAARRRQADEARRYLVLAGDLLRPPAPRLVAVGGLSGTGKSTVAYGAAPALGAVPGARVLRSDVIRKRLFDRALDEPLPPAAYGPDVSVRVYGRLREQAAAALAAGHSVIADAVYASPSERADIAAVARVARVEFTGLWLEAPADVLEDRIRARRGDASDATVEVLRRQLSIDTGPIGWQRIDASGPLPAVVARIRRLLGLPAASQPAG